MTTEFNIPAEGTIPYKYFAVPTNFTEDKYVQLAEIRQGDRAHVHHIIISVRYPGSGPLPEAGEISLEARRPQGAGAPAAGGPARSSVEDSDGRLVGWAPGEAPLMLRAGQAKLGQERLRAGLPGALHDQRRAGQRSQQRRSDLLQSAGREARHHCRRFRAQFSDPPGEPHYESTGSFVFKEDSHIDSLHPHMHVRGKDFKYTLVYPDGTSKVLLAVPRYDFAWQLTYVFKEEVAGAEGQPPRCRRASRQLDQEQVQPRSDEDSLLGRSDLGRMMIGYLDYTIDKQDLRKAQPQAASSSSGQ
jgi:hypothetical protein